MSNLKLYILVRTDIDVSIGKLMVHVGHICTNIAYGWKDWWFIRDWIDRNQHTIIILKVKNLTEIRKYYNKWKKGFPNKPAVMIRDAGFYEVEKGTILMCGIGPIYESEAKEIGLDKLSLYKK